MKVVIINGSGGVGKSTFVKLCREIYPRTYELSMVDFVKEVANYIGWKGEKDEKARKFLSDLKDVIDEYDESIIYKSIDNDMYFNLVMCEAINVEPVFFINARSPKDIKYLSDKYNAKTLLIKNDRITHVTSNHADADVFSYQYDYIIDNNKGLRELKEKAKDFIENLI